MAVRDWLSRFKGGEDDRHPLAGERGLQEFLQSLPESQAAMSLDQGFDALESAQAAKLEASLLQRALRAVDEHLQGAVGELWHLLFRDARGDQVSEPSLVALNQYYRRAALAYASALDALPRDAAKEVQEHAPLLACRGMAALVQRKKLLHIGYRSPDAELWETVNRIYIRARALGVLRNRIELYGPGEPVSAANEHLVGLLFEVAPLGNMLPTQMQCLDALLRMHAAGFVSGEQHAAGTPFYADLTRPQAPQRWLEGLTPRGSLRFFGLGPTYLKIQSLARQSLEAPDVPDWAVPSECDLDGYRKLLAMCVEHWSEKPPQRRHRRLAGGDEIVVVYGFGQTRRMVAASEFARTAAERGFTGFQSDNATLRDAKYFDRIRFGSVDPDKTQSGKAKKPVVLPPPKELLEKIELEGDRQLMQRWKIADTSDSGIGATPPSTASWAKLGVLVGYRQPESIDWQVAVIRRLGRTPDNKLSVGLERVNGDALSVRVLPVAGAERAAWEHLPIGGEGTEDAVQVSGPAGLLLLLPPGRYRTGQHYLVWADIQRYAVEVTSVYPAGKDYQPVAVSRAG